jgi:hypothetical protein
VAAARSVPRNSSARNTETMRWAKAENHSRGSHLARAGAIGKKVLLRVLDAVFDFSARAIKLLVESGNVPLLAQLRHAKRDASSGTVEAFKKISFAIRKRFGRRVRIIVRADSGFAREEIFQHFEYRTRKSWSRARRVVGKAEILDKGQNPRFVVTNLPAEGFDPLHGNQAFFHGYITGTIVTCPFTVFAKLLPKWALSRLLRANPKQ